MGGWGAHLPGHGGGGADAGAGVLVVVVVPQEGLGVHGDPGPAPLRQGGVVGGGVRRHALSVRADQRFGKIRPCRGASAGVLIIRFLMIVWVVDHHPLGETCDLVMYVRFAVYGESTCDMWVSWPTLSSVLGEQPLGSGDVYLLVERGGVHLGGGRARAVHG